MAEKDATIAANAAALAERDDMIWKPEAVIASSAGPEEIEELKLRPTLVEVDKELEHKKARHFRLQVTAANVAK